MKRTPAVAGQFYPGDPETLRSELNRYIVERDKKSDVFGIVSPHAGYVYSGSIAGKVFGAIRIPDTVLIIGPNHHGRGAPAALYPDGEWLTPLGSIPICSTLNSLLRKHLPLLRDDAVAHEREHSLEVQVPFIQVLRPEAALSAICLGYGDFPAVREIGTGLASAIAEFASPVLIVASSDMTHYESAESAARKDRMALDKLLAFDPEGLLQVCRREKITMCGVVPSAVMLVAAQALGATRAELLCYGTSGDVTGDNRQVVGYASVALF